MDMTHKAKRPHTAMASAAALALIIGIGLSSCSQAGEENATEQEATGQPATEQSATEQAATEPAMNEQDPTVQNAKARLKAMSDYLAAQKAISLGYDSVFEVVSKESQKLQLATSGTIVLNRPDKIRATRKIWIFRYRDGLRWEDIVDPGQGPECLCSGGGARHDRHI